MVNVLVNKGNYQFYMETDVHKYIGEWIAICDNKIIAHGNKIKEVANEARKICGNKKILLARVPDKESMLY